MLSFTVVVLVSVLLARTCLIARGENRDGTFNTTEKSQPASYEQTVCPFTEVEDIEYMPHFVKLCTPRECFCTGAIVAFHWIVTAGHCVYKNSHPIDVYTTNEPLPALDRAKKHSVARTVLHPSFGVRHGYLKIRNNIALLSVEPAFKFDWVLEKFPLSIHPPIEGVTYPVYSMGKNVIRVYNVTVLGHRECKRALKMPAHTYCSDGCHIASDLETGGPMFDGDELLGIVSFGETPLRTTFTPGVVFVQICDYIQWIAEVVAKGPQMQEAIKGLEAQDEQHHIPSLQ